MEALMTAKQLRATEALMVRSGVFSVESLIATKTASFHRKLEELSAKGENYLICCGFGQKGAIGMALAIELKEQGANVRVCMVNNFAEGAEKEEETLHLKHLATHLEGLSITCLEYNGITNLGIGKATIIDAILDPGTYFVEKSNAYLLAQRINKSQTKVVAVGGPSGFPMEGPVAASHFAIYASIVICFTQVDINFYLPDSYPFVKEFHLVSIEEEQEEQDDLFQDEDDLRNDADEDQIGAESLIDRIATDEEIEEGLCAEAEIDDQETGTYFINETGAVVSSEQNAETTTSTKDIVRSYFLTVIGDIKELIQPRAPFSHKGSFGHALIIAGSTHSMGAALICADSCLRAGAGLITLCIPPSGFTAANIRMPEVMTLEQEALSLSDAHYNVIGIGPGLSTSAAALTLLTTALDHFKGKMVLDADALNLLAQMPDFHKKLQSGWILTPHVKEFDRLFGEHATWHDRIETGSAFAIKNQVIIILKNQYTHILLPNGRRVINTTGNPAMASAGMGDALTGIITSLLAQGLQPDQAAYAGCYIHGMAGDYLYSKGEQIITATGVAWSIPALIYQLQRST